jgi:hypothetical protein
MSSQSTPKSSISQAGLDRGPVRVDDSNKQVEPLFVRFASEPTAKQVP